MPLVHLSLISICNCISSLINTTYTISILVPSTLFISAKISLSFWYSNPLSIILIPNWFNFYLIFSLTFILLFPLLSTLSFLSNYVFCSIIHLLPIKLQSSQTLFYTITYNILWLTQMLSATSLHTFISLPIKMLLKSISNSCLL